MAANASITTVFGSAVVATPSDTAFVQCQAFMCGVAGAIAFQNQAGTTITLAAVPAYTVIPIAAVRIMSTGTAATNIILLT
jgi:hypothetical protein